MKREAWAPQTTATSNFVCWPCTMPVSRHSYEEPSILRMRVKHFAYARKVFCAKA